MLPLYMRDVSFPLAIEERSRSDQEWRVDAIFKASSKIWHELYNLSFPLHMPLQGLQCKSTRILACRILFEVHLLNGFQYAGEVGRADVAFN